MKKLLLTTAILASMAFGAQAQTKAGDVILRLRAIEVAPDESASTTIGGTVNASNAVVPELDGTYFITDNIAAELIAATSKHKTYATSGGLDLGSVWALPPTLTLQYHFNNGSDFTPYAGAGINYTHFYNAKAGSSISNIKYGDSVGPALQAGLDYKLTDKYSLNLDIKKIWMNSNVKINSGGVKADVNLDPWVVGFGVGYKF